MVARIRQLLELRQLSPTQFADLIGVGRPVMSHILSERNKPSLEVVQRIRAACPEISLPWLLDGVGDMLVAVPPGAADAAPVAAPASPPPPVPRARKPPAIPPPAPILVPVAAARPALNDQISAAQPALAPEAVPTHTVSALAVGTAAPLPAAHAAPATAHAAPATGPASPVPIVPAASTPAPSVEAASLAFLGEPGKAIRRIVIFYRDGSFSDYLPEQ